MIGDSAHHTKRITVIVSVVALTLFSMWYVNFNIAELLAAIPNFMAFLFFDFLPPNFSDMPMYIQPVIDTVLLAFLATGLSSIFGVLLALLIAKNTAPFRSMALMLRAVLSFCRNVPKLVWAAVLVIIFGIGNLPGLLAITIFGTSFLARVYAESIENLDDRATEAIYAVGGTKLHVIKHALLPQFLPSYLSWTLFMVELGIRASAILGLVGAGGLGTVIKQTMDLFQYSKTSAAIVILIVLIIAVETTSQKLRERIL